MDYQVWTKEDYGELWTVVLCGDVAAAKRELDKAVRQGKVPMLTQEIPYELGIKLLEPGTEVKKTKVETKRVIDIMYKEIEDEAEKSKPQGDQDPGGEGNG